MEDNSFGAKTRDQRLQIVQQIIKIAQETGLDLNVQTSRETVCQLFGMDPGVMEQNSLRVIKDFPIYEKEKVDAFNEKIKPIIEGMKGIQVQVRTNLSVGDMYKPIKDVLPLDNDKPVEISHYEGQVVLVTFYITWAPPCQQPITQMQQIMSEKKADWGDKVRFICVSFDQDKEEIVEYVKEKSLKDIEHFCRSYSKCGEDFGVPCMPFAFILDKSGKIVFKGDPMLRQNLLDDIETLLNDQLLQVPGILMDKSNMPVKDEETKETLNPEDCHANVDEFKIIAKSWCENQEYFQKSREMARNFCVLVVQENYDTNTGKVECKFRNIREIVGKT